MKNLILSFLSVYFILFGTLAIGQLTLTNGIDKVDKGDTLIINEISVMKMNFSNLKVIDPALYGRIVVGIEPIGKGVHQNYYPGYFIEGSTACEAFIEKQNQEIILSGIEKSESVFGLDFKQLLKDIAQENFVPIIQFKLRIYYQDMIKYDEYGTPVDLIEPFNFYVNLLYDGNYFAFDDFNLFMKYEDAVKAHVYKSYSKGKVNLPKEIVDENGPELIIYYTATDVPGDETGDVFTFIAKVTSENQSAGMEKLKTHITDYVKTCSNYRTQAYNPLASYGISSDKVKPTDLAVSELLPIVYMAKFDKRENKNYENEVLFQEFKTGIFSGFQFSTELKDIPDFTTSKQYLDFKLVMISGDPSGIYMCYTTVNENSEVEIANVNQFLDILYKSLEIRKY